MREGRLGYNSYNKRYGLLSSDLWIDTGFHCGECLEVLLDDEWVQTRMEMNPAREWYLVGTPYCGDLEYIRASIFVGIQWDNSYSLFDEKSVDGFVNLPPYRYTLLSKKEY